MPMVTSKYLMCFSLTRVYSRYVKKTSKRLTIMKKNKKFVSNYFLTVVSVGVRPGLT